MLLNQFAGTLRVALSTNVTGGTGDCNGMRGAYSSVGIPLYQWTHVAATYDEAGDDRNDGDGSVGRIRIFVNGDDVTTSELYATDPCYAQPGSGEDAMFPNSDHDDASPESWWASPLSIGGLISSSLNVFDLIPIFQFRATQEFITYTLISFGM